MPEPDTNTTVFSLQRSDPWRLGDLLHLRVYQALTTLSLLSKSFESAESLVSRDLIAEGNPVRNMCAASSLGHHTRFLSVTLAPCGWTLGYCLISRLE